MQLLLVSAHLQRCLHYRLPLAKFIAPTSNTWHSFCSEIWLVRAQAGDFASRLYAICHRKA
jgi:hypothetical protein